MQREEKRRTETNRRAKRLQMRRFIRMCSPLIRELLWPRKRTTPEPNPQNKAYPDGMGLQPPHERGKIVGGGIIKLKSSAYLTMTLSRP